MSKPEAIRSYFAAFKSRDRDVLERILAPNLVHESPWATYDSRQTMLDTIWPQVGKTWAVDLTIFGCGDEYVATYAHHEGDGSRIAERFVFDGELIKQIKVYMPEA